MKGNMKSVFFFRPQRRTLLVASLCLLFLVVFLFRARLLQSLGFQAVCGVNIVPRDTASVRELRRKMERILEDCGEVCETRPEKLSVIGQKFYKVIKKDFECRKLFESKVFDEPAVFPVPPEQIPYFMVDHFSYHGQVAISSNYYNSLSSTGPPKHWTVAYINLLREQFRAGLLFGTYGYRVSRLVYDHLTNHMDAKGKHFLVIGTEIPWVEALLLEAGARVVTTLEYGVIHSQHPQLKSAQPDEFAAKYLNGTLEQFDGMVTFSSVEHSGMGRYGDGLNPYGDLITMARSWCVLKDGAFALIGVPTDDVDRIEFNAHRIYGPVMYSHLLANWEQIHASSPREDLQDPVIVRKNKSVFALEI